MNRLFLAAAFSTILFASCQNKDANEAAAPVAAPTAAANQSAQDAFNKGVNFRRADGTTLGYSQAISVDEANDMIQSYLTSVGYPQQDNSLRALVFDAQVLRSYL